MHDVTSHTIVQVKKDNNIKEIAALCGLYYTRSAKSKHSVELDFDLDFVSSLLFCHHSSENDDVCPSILRLLSWSRKRS